MAQSQPQPLESAKRDLNWDATITSKSKSKNLNELFAQAQSQAPLANLKNSLNSLKDSKVMNSNKNIKRNLVESQELRPENLKNSKVLSTSSNQSRKEEIESNKSFKASEKASMNNTSRLFNNPIGNKNGVMSAVGNKNKGTINRNDISQISYQSNRFMGTGSYSPRSDKLKPLYYEFDIFLRVLIILQWRSLMGLFE